MDEKYVYLNLQQQVGKNKRDIADLWATKFALERAGVRVVGEEASASDLPDPITYGGEPGDAYLIGTEAPFDMYIFTQPSVGETNFKWFNIGPFPAPGEQGEQGEQGDPGPAGASSKWRFGSVNPSILETDRENDGYLNTATGVVFMFDGERWISVGSIRGPQGVQGPKGDTGAQGIQGAKGDTGARGPAGIVIEVIAVLDNTGSLPDPSTVERNAGYIINDDLYIIVEDENQDLTWYDAGSFTGVPGQAAVISSATASVVRQNMGTTPTVTILMGGTSSNRTFAFTFNLPLPAGDIIDSDSGSASNTNGWTQRVIASKTFRKVITSLSDLGLTAPVTTEQILYVLGSSYSNTCVMISNDTNFERISDAPKAKGQLFIIQGTPTRNYDVRYVDDSYDVFIYDGSIGNPEVAQWNRILTTKDALGVGTPAGGTTGQILAKKSDDDFDTEWEDVPNAPNGTPDGGTTGQILAKKSGTDYDDEWIDAPTGVPDGGSTGQMLVKQSNADGDAAWQTPPVGLPAAGTAGQVLSKDSGTNFDVSWRDTHEVPAGGTTGQVLSKGSGTNFDISWRDTHEVPTNGTTGQVLTKSELGYGWQDPATSGGGGYMPNLLINSDFKINQRGSSSYTNTSSTAKYTVDRWSIRSIGGASVGLTVQEAGVSIAGSTENECLLTQVVEGKAEYLGKKVTLSFRIGYNIRTLTVQLPSTVPASATELGFLVTDNLAAEIWFNQNLYIYVNFRTENDNGVYIDWAKLELGETATPYIYPDPVTELEKCRYYYQPLTSFFLPAAVTAVNYSNNIITSVSFVVYYKITPMRIIPTKGTANTAGKWIDVSGGSHSIQITTSYTYVNNAKDGIIDISIANYTTNAGFVSAYVSGYRELDAEIYP